jgi:hypothetical protein
VVIPYVHLILPKADPQFAICCSIALVFVYLKAIYLVAAAFAYNISLRNPFIVHPHCQRQANFRTRDGMPVQHSLQVHNLSSQKLILDFLASLLCVIGGFLAPPERKEATRAYDNELEQQQNGGGGYIGRYNWATNPFNGGSNKQETSYSRA